MLRFSLALAGIFSLFLLQGVAFACDLCAIYSARGALNNPKGSFRLGVTERYTRYEGTAEQFRSLSETFGMEQSLDSSITQLAASYQLSEDIGVQLNIPFIYREYTRLEVGREKKGDEYGVGDSSLLLHYELLKKEVNASRFGLEVYGGLKLPTGDDDRLQEEQNEQTDLNSFLHGVPNGNLVDGADLALGSGSFDFPLGFALHAERGRFFFASDLQLHLRTEGAYDFQYGNSLFFNVKPGGYLYLEHNFAVALAASFSGDFKDKDKLRGSSLADSDENLLFLGPELRISAYERLSAFFSYDFVLSKDSAETGVQPEYRILLGLSYKL